MSKFFSYFPGDKSEAPGSEPDVLLTMAMERAAGVDKRRRAVLSQRFPERGQMELESYRQRAATVATEPAIDAWRPDDPALLAGFDLGAFQYDAWPGQLILPEVRVQPLVGSNGAMTIEIPSWGNEHFQIPNAQRGLGAGYNWVDTDPTTVTKKLGLYGLAAKKDTRVQNKANPSLRLSARMAGLALRGLELHRETRVRNLVLDTSNYTASHAVALTTEWDHASGDSKSDFDSLFTTITASCGIPRELFTVTLTSYDSLDAAFNDPTFIAQRTSTLGTSPTSATLAELARYWRVRRVTVADCRAEISGTVQSLWGDNAVVHWAGDNNALGADLANLELEDFMGAPFVGATFIGNPGIAKVPFESNEGLRTETVWPVDAADVPWITSYTALGLLTNVKA